MINSFEYDTLEITNFLQLSQFFHPSWVEISDYMNAWVGNSREPVLPRDLFCKQIGFVEFMSDQTRCQDLFIDPETAHTQLALCCIKNIVAAKASTLANW